MIFRFLQSQQSPLWCSSFARSTLSVSTTFNALTNKELVRKIDHSGFTPHVFAPHVLELCFPSTFFNALTHRKLVRKTINSGLTPARAWARPYQCLPMRRPLCIYQNDCEFRATPHVIEFWLCECCSVFRPTCHLIVSMWNASYTPHGCCTHVRCWYVH